jgi:hypothetical protein
MHPDKLPNHSIRITDFVVAKAGQSAAAQAWSAALRACLMQMIAFTRWLASCLILVSWDSVSSTMSASQSWAKAFSFDNVYP